MWHSSLSAKVNMFGVYGDTEVTVAMVAMITSYFISAYI